MLQLSSSIIKSQSLQYDWWRRRRVENLGMGRKSVWLLQLTISILSLLKTANSFDGGGTNPKPQPTLCDELILPAGYPCSEYVVSIHYVFPIIPLLFCVLIYICCVFLLKFLSGSNNGWFLVRSSARVFFCSY
jgi:hypothetical protein